MEEYFSRVPGVLDAVSGYANGRSETTRYELIGQTGHAETVQVTYDASQVSLREILLHYFRIINPLSKNKQGNDVGSQYRTGVYYTDDNDLPVIKQVFQEMSEQYGQPLAVGVVAFATLYSLLRSTIRIISRSILGATAISMSIKPQLQSLMPVPITSQIRRILRKFEPRSLCGYSGKWDGTCLYESPLESV